MGNQSRIEQILTTSATGYSKEPLSRIEALLLKIGGIVDGEPIGGDLSDKNDFSELDIDDIMDALSTEND